MFETYSNFIKVYKFDIFEEHDVSVIVSTRVGGFSAPPFETLNVGDGIGDSEIIVRKNRRKLFETVNFDYWRVLFSEQVHAADVCVVDDFVEGVQADVFISRGGRPFAIKVADCVPVALFDPVERVGALVHAGWRGTALKAVSKAVLTMEGFGCNPKNILVGIGPAISFDDFVFDDVVYLSLSKSFPGSSLIVPFEEKFKTDLALLNKVTLLEFGVLDANIEVCSYKTSERPLFFSHRRLALTGRFCMAMNF